MWNANTNMILEYNTGGYTVEIHNWHQLQNHSSDVTFVPEASLKQSYSPEGKSFPDLLNTGTIVW